MEKFYIAIAPSRTAKQWQNVQWTWREMMTRLRDVKRTAETMEMYDAASKEVKGTIKDVGGFVAGYLRDGKRSARTVESRSLITLDIDHPKTEDAITLVEEIRRGIRARGWAAYIYSTHSHRKAASRLRVVLPMDNETGPEEYEAIARKVAEMLCTSGGMEDFDTTTFDPSRLFYWPSGSADAEVIGAEIEGVPVDTVEVLAMYRDWHDVSEWPRASREMEVVCRAEGGRALPDDPRAKPGVIGAFCRAYPISVAISEFLSAVYDTGSAPNRYSYTFGSTANGVVTYEDKWLFSHHNTDPAGGGHLRNAYDLLRIHRFGHLDKREAYEGTPPSAKAMDEWCRTLPEVNKILIADRRKIFADVDLSDVKRHPTDSNAVADTEAETVEEDDVTWEADLLATGKLRTSGKGNLTANVGNFSLILEHDPKLKGCFGYDSFKGLMRVIGDLPWPHEDGENMTTFDYAELAVYMDNKYQIEGKDKLADALHRVANRHQTHPVRDYLDSLVWDGTPRLERLFIDVLGADDTEANRWLCKIFFVAAVARIRKPGVKFDLCPVLYGREGCGKSSTFEVMAGAWFNDSVTTFEGKEVYEAIRGSWILELAEMAALTKSGAERAKGVITSTADRYRPAYGRDTIELKRQCVFAATTNNRFCLRGLQGNRRNPVIEIKPEKRKVTERVRPWLLAHRDQLWAEADHIWRAERPDLFPSDEMAEMLARNSELYNADVQSDLADIIDDYLATKLPEQWSQMDATERTAWLAGRDATDRTGTRTRKYFNISEFLVERGPLFTGQPRKALEAQVRELMSRKEGWEYRTSLRGYFGTKTRGWVPTTEVE